MVCAFPGYTALEKSLKKDSIINHHRTRETHGSHFWISSSKLILFLGVNKKELRRVQGDIPEKFIRLTIEGKGGIGEKRLPLQYWSSSGPNIVFHTATAMPCPLWSLLFPGNVGLLFVLSNFELLKDLKLVVTSCFQWRSHLTEECKVGDCISFMRLCRYSYLIASLREQLL